jgi:hypothetical protein
MFGNQNNVLSARMQGVRTARDGSTAQGTGPANTVTHVFEGKVKFVGFNDERGNPRVAMYFEVGGKLYAPADTVAWCDKLMPITEWMEAGVAEAQKRSAPVSIPKEDTVEVMDDENPAGGSDEDSTPQ